MAVDDKIMFELDKQQLSAALFITGTFTDSWIVGYYIEGWGVVVPISINYKGRKITITNSQLYANSKWHDIKFNNIMGTINSATLIFDHPTDISLNSGSAYLIQLTGDIT